MRTVRMRSSRGPFIRGQRVAVVEERGKDLYLKGMHLSDPIWAGSVVVSGPFSEDQVEEYVPEPPEPTIAEKMKEIWP